MKLLRIKTNQINIYLSASGNFALYKYYNIPVLQVMTPCILVDRY
jgi:hypothetical protein